MTAFGKLFRYLSLFGGLLLEAYMSTLLLILDDLMSCCGCGV
jgi:hypothetical protein